MYEAARPVFMRYTEMEREATAISCYEPLLIPGLLQTEAYAREVLRVFLPSELREDALRVRMERQKAILASRAELRFVVDAAGLLRRVGGSRIMAVQVDHITALAASGRVSFRVVTSGKGAHIGLMGSFTCLEFADQPPMVYFEDSRTGDSLRPAGGYLEHFRTLDRIASSL